VKKYLFDLAYMVLGTFLATLAGLATADGVFNVLTFQWGTALASSGSAAALVLIQGLAARFQGDKDRARFTSPQR
jgi:ABC-type nickel/cobalt efflux system permease component RcnA